jgi:hypothetical protein
VVFYFATRIVPVLANTPLQDLPAAFRPTATLTPMPTSADPLARAPFHFKTDTTLLQDDFNTAQYDGAFNPDLFFFDLRPRAASVQVAQKNGALNIDFPVACLDSAKMWECELQFDSRRLEMSKVQYFGFRARSLSHTAGRGLSISISFSQPSRARSGFGWNFTDTGTAFFRPVVTLPEKGFYAYVDLDAAWHAYEILRDPTQGKFYYYVDGQLIDTYTSPQIQAWESAPLELIIYSLKSSADGARVSTQWEIDEIKIGGFNAK